MRGLSATAVLDLWDSGLDQSPPRRALQCLMAACPEASADTLAALSIGQRDARLLALRQSLWGPQMSALATCPACCERIEMLVDARQLLAGPEREPASVLSLRTAGYDLAFRLPNSLDLLAAVEQPDPAAGADILLQRCLLSGQDETGPLEAGAVPTEILATIAESMADADPLADIRLAVQCPSCAHRWRVTFDIASFLWTEIEAWAMRMLKDVHTLARAYGWRERDILSLSPVRRQAYLTCVGE